MLYRRSFFFNLSQALYVSYSDFMLVTVDRSCYLTINYYNKVSLCGGVYMAKNDNVVSFPTNKLSKPKSDVDVTNYSSYPERSSISISQRLRATIDDELKQQMREQMRKKHGIE